jgi:hypothetical protein
VLNGIFGQRRKCSDDSFGCSDQAAQFMGKLLKYVGEERTG